MRKSREEAARTRERIVGAASGEFRKGGIRATGLNDLMKAAGLSHGGFYKHFDSKDQFVAEAVARAVDGLIARLGAAGPWAGAAYLSTLHRDDPAQGCPLAAIGSELARGDAATRDAATDGLLKLVLVVAGTTGEATTGEARRRALAAASTMIGALTMARVVDDPELSGEILRSAEEAIHRKG